MTEKRFNRVGGYVYDGDKCISHFEDVTHRDDIITLLNGLHEENEQLKHKNEVLTKKIDRLLNKRKGNEETNLKIMSYLHDNYYNIWEEVLKECYNE